MTEKRWHQYVEKRDAWPPHAKKTGHMTKMDTGSDHMGISS